MTTNPNVNVTNHSVANASTNYNCWIHKGITPSSWCMTRAIDQHSIWAEPKLQPDWPSRLNHPFHHEWVWFRLEGQSGCSLGSAQMECQSVAFIIHQELGVMPLWTQQLNHHDVLIEFDSEVDVERVVQKLLRIEWWMGAPCNLECIPCSDKEGLWQFRGG